MIAHKPRWLRFSLRTLLVVIAIVGVALGLIGARLNQLRHQWQAIKAIRDLGGVVWYDDEQYGRVLQTNPMATVNEFLGRREPTIAELSGKAIKNDDLKLVIQIPSLKILFLSNVSVTNEGLKELEVLNRLQTLGCTRDPRHEKLLLRLEEPTQLDTQDGPLQELLLYLKDLHKIDFVLDTKAFATAGINAVYMPMTAKFTNIELRELLDKLLHPHEMGWIIADGKVVITTRDIAEKNHQVAEQLRAAIPSLTDVRVD